jgi:hypothetical protein
MAIKRCFEDGERGGRSRTDVKEGDMRKAILGIQAMALLSASAAMAQSYKPVTAVKVLTGWQCMALASSYGPNGTNAPPAPVYAGPDSAAPKVGTGAGVIIVPSPMAAQDGRTVMIWPNGKKVWIDVSELTRWHSLSNPHATCQPALMSNGRYGYTTSN